MLKCSVIRNCLRLWPFMNNGSKHVTQTDLVYIYSAVLLQFSFLLSSKDFFFFTVAEHRT